MNWVKSTRVETTRDKDAGHRIQDTGQATRHMGQDTGQAGVQDAGRRTQDAGHRTQIEHFTKPFLQVLNEKHVWLKTQVFLSI